MKTVGEKPYREPPLANEAELVGRAQRGDKEAFQLLVEHYQARAFALAFQLLRSKEDAQDVTQESFVKAYLSLKNFRGDSSFYTWLYRIVRNMAIDLLRKEGRGKEGRGKEGRRETGELDQNEAYPEVEGVLVGTASRNAESELQSREELTQVDQALQNLSETHREVLMLREVDGFSYDEIAKVLGVKRGTVMSRLFYAREKLQEVLGVRNELSTKSTEVSVSESEEISKASLKGVERYGQKQSA